MKGHLRGDVLYIPGRSTLTNDLDKSVKQSHDISGSEVFRLSTKRTRNPIDTDIGFEKINDVLRCRHQILAGEIEFYSIIKKHTYAQLVRER